MPVWVWSTLVFGGTLMVALFCWLLYFKFYSDVKGFVTRGPLPPAPSPPAPEASAQPAPGHPGFADAAARGAIAAAARAQAAAHNSLEMFGKKRALPRNVSHSP